MTNERVLLFSLLGAALALFAWGRLRYDIVAVLVLLIAVALGLVPAATAFSGFGIRVFTQSGPIAALVPLSDILGVR